MSTLYPAALDDGTTLPNPTGASTLNSPDHGAQHANNNDATKALEAKVGIGAATPVANRLFTGTGTGTSDWSKVAPAGTIVGTSDSQTLTNKTLTSPTINGGTIDNATVTVDTVAGHTVSNTGTIYGIPITTGNIAAPGTLSVAGATTLTGAATASSTFATVGQPSFQTSTAPPAAGASTAGIKLSSTANLGLFFGSGAPTFSAAQGALYMRTDGSSTSTRMYVNTNGSTTWTNLVTAA